MLGIVSGFLGLLGALALWIFGRVFDVYGGMWMKLLLAIAIDVVGMATYLVPVGGEALDAAWAPISAGLVHWLYGNNIISMVNFAEEALPFVDVLPMATIGWVLTYTGLGRGTWIIDWLRRGKMFGGGKDRSRSRHGSASGHSDDAGPSSGRGGRRGGNGYTNPHAGFGSGEGAGGSKWTW